MRRAGGEEENGRDRAGAIGPSEQEARQLADTMPHIVWTATGDGAVDYFNGRWYEYTGQPPEESPSAIDWRSAVHPDDLGRLLGLRDPAVEGGQGFQADVRLRDRDGRYRWHIVRSVPVRDASGRVIRRFGTATDIDDRRRAEEALRAGEQRFRFLAESIPHLVWTCRPDGVVDYASPRLSEYLGIRAGRARSPEPGSRPSIPTTATRTLAEPGSDACARGPSSTSSTACAAPTGPIDGSWATPGRSATTPAGWWAGTAPAPTSTRQWRSRQEIVRLNRDLKARVDELETLFETIPIGIAIAEDAACRRIRANPALERLLELARRLEHLADGAGGERPPGTSSSAATGGEVAPDDLPMQVAAREGRPIVGDTLEAVFDDGRTKLIHGNAAPLFDEDGRPRAPSARSWT